MYALTKTAPKIPKADINTKEKYNQKLLNLILILYNLDQTYI